MNTVTINFVIDSRFGSIAMQEVIVLLVDRRLVLIIVVFQVLRRQEVRG